MIWRLMNYPYGGVRARALATRLLEPRDIAALAESGSLNRAETTLESRLAGGGQEALECRLYADYLDFGRVILRTLPDPAAALLQAFLQRSWVENLLLLCRALTKSHPVETSPALLPTLEKRPLPDPDKVRTLKDLVGQLPAGPYRQALKRHAETTAEPSRAILENDLLRVFWDVLDDRTRQLPPVDRQAVTDSLTRRADIDALRVLRRGLAAGLGVETISAAWPRQSHLFTGGRLRRVVAAADPQTALEDLLQTTVPGSESDGPFEIRLRRHLRQVLRRGLLAAPFTVLVPMSALLLKELEMMTLKGVLGGLRFGLDSEEISTMAAI
jgi:vacuolar-type H+-ATPase subunit C/Vma6